MITKIEACGGEGVVLKKPNSHYECGYSKLMLKVSMFIHMNFYALCLGKKLA